MIKLQNVHAHCDIPCKIYDPAIPQIAALSVVRLLDLIHELELDNEKEHLAEFTRLVNEKETQAKLVKEEIRIIWGDYFKGPQIEKFPEIHHLTHTIMMTASKCKQSLDRLNGINLVDEVNQFTEIFWATKEVETHKVIAPYPPSLEIIRPLLQSD